jgi:hypothetical protein
MELRAIYKCRICGQFINGGDFAAHFDDTANATEILLAHPGVLEPRLHRKHEEHVGYCDFAGFLPKN